MKIDWSPLKTELSIWRRSGLRLPFWWRDDDAEEDTAALRKLQSLSAETGVSVHIAVIPKLAKPSLASYMTEHANLIPVVHGWQHKNHNPAGRKKSEFGDTREGVARDLEAAMATSREIFGDRLLPMFVPPWNNFADVHLPLLAEFGYRSLSTYTPRTARMAAPGVVQVNTHIDPIFWRGGGGLVPPSKIVAQITGLLNDRRLGPADAEEPLGLLTHHLAHDGAIWAFTAACLEVLIKGGGEPIDLSKYEGALR